MLGELDPEAIGPALQHATHYEPTPLADFNSFLKALPADLEPATTTFVDVGSGMGRVVLLAAKLPFKQIVGIEVSPALHEIAKENLANYPAAHKVCHDIRFIRADASSRALPKGDLLVYLYNPFDAIAMRAFAQRLIGRRGEDAVWVMYHTPADPDAIKETAAFATVCEFDFGVLYKLI